MYWENLCIGNLFIQNQSSSTDQILYSEANHAANDCHQPRPVRSK